MVITGTYNLLQEDYWRLAQLQELYLECDTTLAPVTINLCAISDLERFWNVKIYISDISNNAFSNNITINCDASDKINLDGQTSEVILQNGGSCVLSVTNENTWVAFISYDDLDGYTTIQDHGLDMPQRNTLDFQGGCVVVTDNGTKTIATILSGNSFGLFAQTGNSIAITNTIIEGTLIDGGLGTLTVPANGFSVGDSFNGIISGVISSKNNTTLRIRVKAGSIVLGDTGFIIMPQTTNKRWELQLQFTIRAVGNAGVASIITSGLLTYSKDASNIFEGSDFSTLNTTTFNTTISNTLDITAQWGAAEVQNNIFTQYFTLNKVF
jgi:hypothetical protein